MSDDETKTHGRDEFVSSDMKMPTQPCNDTRRQVILACLGLSLSVVWFPVLVLFEQFYLEESLGNSLSDMALLGFTIGTILLSLIGFIRSHAQKAHSPIGTGGKTRIDGDNSGATSYLLFVPVLFVFGCICLWIGTIPSSVTGILYIAGAFFCGCAFGSSNLMWSTLTDSLDLDSVSIVLMVTLGVAGLLVFIGFFTSLQIAIALSAAAVTCSTIVASRLARSGSCEDPDSPENQSPLFIDSVRSFDRRFFISAICIGLAFSLMLYQFITASYDRVDTCIWLSGFVGVAILCILVSITKHIYKEPDCFLIFRLVMITAIPAFFPVNPGTQFSLCFALIFSLISTFAFLGALLLVAHDIHHVIVQSSGLEWLGIALGTLLGVIMGIAIESYGEPSDSTSIIRISLLGASCMILLFISTSILIDRDKLRDIQFLKTGKLPLSYTVYTDIRQSGSSDQNALVSCCQQLAFEYGLTQREAEVLLLLARGNGLAKVQEELYISEGTAITHRSHIYRKLDVHSKQELLDMIEKRIPGSDLNGSAPKPSGA